MSTSFTPILQRVVDRVDGAMGAIFAAYDGEAVDLVTAKKDRDEMLIIAAHYGIILNHVQHCIQLFHFGSAHEIIINHDRMDLLVRAVAEGYYMVLVVKGRVHLATAIREIAAAAQALRAEM